MLNVDVRLDHSTFSKWFAHSLMSGRMVAFGAQGHETMIRIMQLLMA